MKGHKDNPWLGLRSYQEGEIIYGRAEDIERLGQCILSHTQTVLYGRSGIGKTSILNAGIFPIVRKRGYFPVSVRLDHNPNSQSYSVQISRAVLSGINRLRKDGYDENGELTTSFSRGDVRERVKALGDKESLWEFFHRHEFYDAEGQRIKPFVVLDQFEEVFSLGKDKEKIRDFFSELADLLNGVVPDYINYALDEHADNESSTPDGIPGSMPPELIDLNTIQDGFQDYLESSDFHLIITLREDFLSYLERECGKIPALRQNRFCLQPINEKQAAIIIMNPIRGLVDQSVAELIIKKVTGEKEVALDGPPTISVDSAILSLYLRKLYDRLDENETCISAALVESEAENIISGFYQEAISDIPESIVEYLEDTLVNEEGCRENISIYNAKKSIWNLLQDDPSYTKGDVTSVLNRLINERKLLRQFGYGGALRIELIHDILCPVITERKEQRFAIRKQEQLEQENKKEAERLAAIKEHLSETKKRNMKFTAFLAAAALFLCVIGAIIATMGNRNKKQSQELFSLRNEISTILPPVIEQKLLDGDSYSASSLLLRLFPDTLYKYGDPTRTSLLRVLSHNHSTLLQGHSQSVNAVQFSHDGRYAISGSNDMTLKLWDVKTGALLSSNSISRNAVLSVSWNQDNTHIVFSSKDGYVRTCSIQNGILCNVDSLKMKDYARFVTYNPSGTEIIACCVDGYVRVLDVNGLTEKESFRVSKNGATYVSYSPDESLMAIATGSNKTIAIRRVSNKAVITTLSGHNDWVRSVEFSPDGSALVSCSDDRTVRVWDLSTGRGVILGVLPNWGTKAAFTPDGGRVVCSSRDGILRTYDVRTANEIPEFQIKHTGYLNSFDISPDGKRVICGSADPLVHVWDCGDFMDTGVSIHLNGAVYGVSRLEKSKIAAASNRGTLGVWDAENGSSVFVKDVGSGEDARFETIKVSPDGSIIALAAKFKIRLFSVKNGEELGIDNSSGHHGWIRSICFSHDGTLLVSVGQDGKIVFWDIAKKKMLRIINGGSVEFYSVDFSHDDKHIVTGDANGVIRQWEVSTGNPVGNPIIGHTNVVLSVHYNHDDNLILSSSGDQTASIWETDGKLVRQFVGASGYMHDAVFGLSEDEIITASADRYIRIWCVSNGKETARLIGHFGAVSHLEWTSDDKLVSSDLLGEIKVWNVPDLREVADELVSSDASL